MSIRSRLALIALLALGGPAYSDGIQNPPVLGALATASSPLSVANGGTGDTGTGGTTTTPTPSCLTGTPAIVPTATVITKTYGKVVLVTVSVAFAASSIGTCANLINVPIPSGSASAHFSLATDISTTGLATEGLVVAYINSGSNAIAISPPANTFANSTTYNASGFYILN
jgi:hypothetical protein